MVEHTVQKIGDKVGNASISWSHSCQWALGKKIQGRITTMFFWKCQIHLGWRLLGNIRKLGSNLRQGWAQHLQQSEHQGNGGDLIREGLLHQQQDPAQVRRLVARRLLRPQGLQLDGKRWFWSPQRINWQRYLRKWKLQQKKFEVHQLNQHKEASHPDLSLNFPPTKTWKLYFVSFKTDEADEQVKDEGCHWRWQTFTRQESLNLI